MIMEKIEYNTFDAVGGICVGGDMIVGGMLSLGLFKRGFLIFTQIYKMKSL